MDSSQFKTEHVAPNICTLWHAVVCFTTEVHTSYSEARRACMTVKQQDDCVTDYKPRSSFTSLGLFKFGAQSHASGTINLHIYIRMRNFLWTISVMCSYFVPPACYK